MKILFHISIFFFLISCSNLQQQKSYITNKSDTTNLDTLTVEKKEKPQIQYTDKQLENYLDSIGRVSNSLLANKVSFVADSTFKNQLQINRFISASDFIKLKQAINEEEIDRKIAKNIFGKTQADSFYLEKDKTPITLISFDKNKNEFNEYAICLGYPDVSWSCKLYFFKKNKILSEHIIEHHYELELKNYKDNDGRTVIYYKENFGTGSGIWQFNFYFYKYYDDKLIPILNELENGNLQNPWGIRTFWLESFVQSINPLTLKMVFYQTILDNKGNRENIVNDSTFVKYTWDEISKRLVGNYENAKINKSQILTYYLADNELLFINVYYKILKSYLKDNVKRQPTLYYLNEVKNHNENN